ncbi:MAG: alkaline phosphatase family protein [Anaerolineae bacterium]|nr:alkaline phosphatase family protein [Anaerolineae bacterium]
MTNRVFALGLDGATFDLIRPWAAEGRLPTLARLMEEGCWGTLRSVIPPLTMPAWASFLTGLSPGRHGLYSFLRREEDSYNFTPFNASYLRAPGLGELLSRRQCRVALVNMPATYPTQPVNGIVVTGLETPGRHSRFTYPEDLGRTLIERFDYEIERSEKYEAGREEAFIAAVERVEQKRLQAALWLLKEFDWDLFSIVFRGTDVIAHAFWRFMDPDHPAHEPEKAAAYGDTILRHYQWMDGAIAAVMAGLDSDTTLMLMSDHGFGGLYRDVYVDNVLERAGLIRLKQSVPARVRQLLFRLGLTPHNAMRLLAALRLQNLVRRMLSGEARAVVKASVSLQSSVDWSRTRVFSLGGGQLYVNLKGRDPQGVVAPGREFEATCRQVEGALHALRDPGTGEPVVERVWRKQEIYGDNVLPDVPDLYVQWRGDHYVDMGGIGFGHGFFSAPIRGRSGGHTMRGIFVAHGPGIKRGQEIEGAQIVDLAPTIMHLMGQPVPSGLDGRVLQEIFADHATRPVAYEEVAVEGQEQQAFDRDEEAVVEQRLRDLGYI